MVAMSRVYPEKLKYKPKGDSVIIMTYETSFFPQKDKIESELKRSSDVSINKLLCEIEHYYEDKNSD